MSWKFFFAENVFHTPFPSKFRMEPHTTPLLYSILKRLFWGVDRSSFEWSQNMSRQKKFEVSQKIFLIPKKLEIYRGLFDIRNPVWYRSFSVGTISLWKKMMHDTVNLIEKKNSDKCEFSGNCQWYD